MEGRDSASPKATHSHAQHGHEGHGPFGAYFRDTGYSLMGSSPSIIHAPLAKRHSPATQPFSVMPTPNPNSNPNPNLNSSPSPGASSVVPNLNPNAIPNPNSANVVYFGGGEPTGPSPASALMVSLAERSSSEPLKRKRGRPRKYTSDVNGGIPPSPRPAAPPKKKGKVSGKKAQLLALGAAGQNFTPHVLTVGAGEDVSTKIITFTSQGPWAVCILSANGAISNATLRHAGVSGGAVTYEVFTFPAHLREKTKSKAKVEVRNLP